MQVLPVIPHAHRVGKQPVAGPVSAADHIARPGSGDTDCSRAEKRLSKTVDDQFGRGLGSTVGVMTAQFVFLVVGAQPLPVAIDLVRRHGNDGPGRLGATKGVQEICRSLHICRERCQGVVIAGANQGLGGQMQHDFGVECRDPVCQRAGIADIADVRSRLGIGTKCLKQGRVCVRFETDAFHDGAEIGQPKAEPASLETGMSCEENPLAPPEPGIWQAGHA